MRSLYSILLLAAFLSTQAQAVQAAVPKLAASQASPAAKPLDTAGRAQLDKLRARLNSFDLLGAEQVLRSVSEREPVDKDLLRSLVHALRHHDFPLEGSENVNWDEVQRLKLKWFHYLVEEKISQTPEEYLALAELYSLASNWQETFAHAETGLKQNPSPGQSFGLYLLQTRALLAFKRVELASQNLDKLKALVPRVYVSETQVRSSFEDHYRDVTIVNMDDAAEYYTQDKSFLAKQDELRELMTLQALKQAPDFAIVHAERSFLLHLDNQEQQALNHINQAIRLDSSNYEYYAKRADIHRDRNDRVAAQRDYLKAISLLKAAQKTRALNPIEAIDLKFLEQMRATVE